MNIGDTSIIDAYQREIDGTSGEQIGLFCPYTVEELIDASGFTPVRLIPQEPTMRYADAYLPGTLCSYLRHIVDMGAAGELGRFRSIIINHSCDGARRTCDVFKKYVPDVDVFFVDTPKKNDPNAMRYFRREIDRMKAYLEGLAGAGITDTTLTSSIVRYNENRELLHRIYEARANDPGVMDIRTLIRILTLNSVCPKQTANRMLSDMLGSMVSGQRRNGKRVFVSGNIFDALPLLQYIEEYGGVVTGDDFCFGGRYFPVTVSEEEESLDALVRRYLFRVPCGRMTNFKERIDYILEQVQKTGSTGVVYTSLKFCDNFLVDFPLVRERLDGLNIPSLFLESEYFSLKSGQVRTRIEAFLERL